MANRTSNTRDSFGDPDSLLRKDIEYRIAPAGTTYWAHDKTRSDDGCTPETEGQEEQDQGGPEEVLHEG
jgi:hypothetical protein